MASSRSSGSSTGRVDGQQTSGGAETGQPGSDLEQSSASRIVEVVGVEAVVGQSATGVGVDRAGDHDLLGLLVVPGHRRMG